jgi:hypothetical protein
MLWSWSLEARVCYLPHWTHSSSQSRSLLSVGWLIELKTVAQPRSNMCLYNAQFVHSSLTEPPNNQMLGTQVRKN